MQLLLLSHKHKMMAYVEIDMHSGEFFRTTFMYYYTYFWETDGAFGEYDDF